MTDRPLFSHLHDDLIPELRRTILQQIELSDTSKSCIHKLDIERVEKSDKWLRRFLEYYSGDVGTACAKIIASFKLQHQLKLRDMTDSYFPQELWQLGSMKQYGVDKENRAVCYLRLKFLRKEKMITELIKRFIAYHFWKLDCLSEGRDGGILVADFKGLPFSHFNLSICLFALSLKDVFPLLLKHLIVLNVPWFAKAFCNTILFAFPPHVRDMMLFSSESGLKDMIHEDQLPPFLNGTCSQVFDGDRAVPDHAPTIREFAVQSLDMSQKEAEQMHELAHQMKLQFLDENRNF